MRRLIKLVVVVLGIRALIRWRKSGQQAELAAPVSPSAATDPADELRRKLAETREDEDAAPASPPESSVADRRAEVHGAGRAALDEMTPPDEA